MIQASLIQLGGRVIEMDVRHICYAAQNSRQSVDDLAKQLGRSLVVRSKNHSAAVGLMLDAPDVKSKFPAALN